MTALLLTYLQMAVTSQQWPSLLLAKGQVSGLNKPIGDWKPRHIIIIIIVVID